MEPSAFLAKLEGFVETKKQDKEQGKSSWIAGIIVFVLTLIAMFVFAWQANKKSKELAKLKHEKNKAEIEKKNLEVAKEVEKNDMKSTELGEQISGLEKKIEDTDSAIEMAEDARRKDQEAISSITSWNDI